jgi:hypothetical protein
MRSTPRTEAFVGNAEIPQVNSEVIGRNVCFPVRIDGYRVDVIGVCICVHLSWSGSNDMILLL